MKIPFIDWNAIEWRTVRPGVERKGFTGEGAAIALHRLHPGHEPGPHSHPNEQIAYIMAGRIRFMVGSEKHILGPGQLIVVPPNVEHWGEVIGDEPVLNLDVFTPARPEYD
jgi:quercetin dioxygenase-like cupin family protein